MPGLPEATITFLPRDLCSFVRRRGKKTKERKRAGRRGLGEGSREDQEWEILGEGRAAQVRGSPLNAPGQSPALCPVSPSCFNVSHQLKTGLWEVVTLTKPLTAAILHRGCEQLPACQCLTEIIAVPTGSFGRQMAEAIPIHLPAAIS